MCLRIIIGLQRASLLKNSSVLELNAVKQYATLSRRYSNVTQSRSQSGIAGESFQSTDQSSPSVASFYAGKSVFLTGGTGFLGKVLVEKLLYSCADIENIYMLVRPKKGLNIDHRMTQLMSDPVFQRLDPKRFNKIVPILGDLEYPKLGISDENERKLLENVSVVIHSAASVKFNQKLEEAWTMSVEGTKMMMDLSRRMKRVEVFVHISTAYTNTDRQVVEEVLYPPPADINEVEKFVKRGVTDKETRQIIKDRPNCYIFAKALTEHLVAENTEYMPTIIVRPAIVTAVKDEPVKGWVGNWFGVTGTAAASSRGFNKVVFGKRSNVLDLIPVDYVSNTIIAAATRYNRSKELQIYNCCSSECNPVTMAQIQKVFNEETARLNLPRAPFSEWYIFTTNKWLMWTVTVLFQYLPAYLADSFRVVRGKKPRYVKIQSIMVQARSTQDFFSSHSWRMHSRRTRTLHAALPPRDRAAFPCDPTHIHWDQYLREYCRGIRTYLEKRPVTKNL